MEIIQSYLELLPYYVFSWKAYAVLLICLLLETAFFAYKRPLFTTELAQDFVYALFKRWLLLPAFLVYTALYKEFYELLFPPGDWQIATDWPLLAQIVVGYLAGDFMVYVTHVMMHKVRPLWHFHAVHHSQKNINPLTTHRTHFIEDFIQDGIQFLPLAILGVGYPTWVAIRAFNWFWAHFIHSNIRWNFGPLAGFFVSPQYHRLHHSVDPEHYDRNFGTRFVIWDRLFGTWCPDRDIYPETGIPDSDFPSESSAHPAALLRQIGRQYLYPFRKLVEDVRSISIGRS